MYRPYTIYGLRSECFALIKRFHECVDTTFHINKFYERYELKEHDDFDPSRPRWQNDCMNWQHDLNNMAECLQTLTSRISSFLEELEAVAINCEMEPRDDDDLLYQLKSDLQSTISKYDKERKKLIEKRRELEVSPDIRVKKTIEMLSENSRILADMRDQECGLRTLKAEFKELTKRCEDDIKSQESAVQSRESKLQIREDQFKKHIEEENSRTRDVRKSLDILFDDLLRRERRIEERERELNIPTPISIGQLNHDRDLQL